MLFYNQKTLTTNTRLENIIEIFKEYQKVPNVPFLTKFTSKFIKHYLDKNSIDYKETPYHIIVNLSPKNNDKNPRKILFMAHLDHPGIVFKDNQEGIFMGLNEPDSLANLINKTPIDMVVYNQSGKFLGKAKVTHLGNDAKQRVKINSDFDIPVNSFGHFDVPRFSQDDKKIYAYNADDGIMVAIMLNLILERPRTKYDIYFVFNKHEEVYQVSSWNLAKKNRLKIMADDIIVNLECLKVDPVSPDKYPPANYENGPVLQLTNKGCLFGYKNKGKNRAEMLVKKISDENNLEIQVGIIGDSCDSRPFSELGITPNICTITIPNKHKHDGADDGDIRPEEIYKKDVECVAELLEKVISSDPIDPVFFDTKGESLSEKIKEADGITDKNLMKFKRSINQRLDIAYKNIAGRGYFFPTNPFEKLMDFVLKIVSYIKYSLNKIR
mgnify:FL=1